MGSPFVVRPGPPGISGGNLTLGEALATSFRGVVEGEGEDAEEEGVLDLAMFSDCSGLRIDLAVKNRTIATMKRGIPRSAIFIGRSFSNNQA
jgi:hypothetical protein